MPVRESSDPEPDHPSLELPSLSGWRRRRRARANPPDVEPEPTPEPTAVEPTPVEPTPVEPTPVEPIPVEPEPEPTVEADEPRRRAPRARRPGGLPTVVVIGVLVGLAVVGLTWASLQACRAARGTPSCGTAGYPLLALVLALSVVVGAVLLRLAVVPDHVSTSTLGVGMAAVIVVLTLSGRLDQPAMIVVVPLISALTFATAHWVATAAAEPRD